MRLFPNEKILLEVESGSKTLTLTTHRIRYHETSWDGEQIVSIMLEQVCSCRLTRRIEQVWILLSILCLVVGGLLLQGAAQFLSFLAALVFGIFYIISWQGILVIASERAVISMVTRGLKTQDIKEAIDKIEEAKNARYLFLESS